MATLILTEKPTAAKSIAEAIADGKPEVLTNKDGVKTFRVIRDGEEYLVVPAAGHLFNLKQDGKGWKYPVFNVKWIPSFLAIKSSSFSKKYFENLKKLAEKADSFISATDYDTEGSVIAYNIFRFLFGVKDGKRMKFSTMTKKELLQSFLNASSHLDFNQIEAGLARHYLDWYWGINTTRALTLAVKNTSGYFSILSAGRVQAPVLALLAEHEKKIKRFKPKPFWEFEALLTFGKEKFTAYHSKGKFWNREEVIAVEEKLKKAKTAIVSGIKRKKTIQKPPVPFDTTTFLSAAYRYFGYSPKQALGIAESLYQKALISYPRTSSQQLPENIGYKRIIQGLANQKQFTKIAKKLLNEKRLKPNNGKKTDPAHPAIYPTGEKPKTLTDRQKKIYDLIVRRFFAVFGKPAIRESMIVRLDINGEIFNLTGKKTIEPGWTELYGKYAKLDEILLPEINKDQEFLITGYNVLDKKTQPPQRFTQGSVLKEMEKRGLGTKATRAVILQTLYSRGYITGKSIRVTTLGMKVAEALKKYCPEIISEELTRTFENETESILEGRTKREKVQKEAIKVVTKIMDKFKKKEKSIGKVLSQAVVETRQDNAILGKCPNCGKDMKIMFSPITKRRFCGCSGYPECKTGFPLPAKGKLMRLDAVCDSCKTSIIQVNIDGKRPFRMCLDPLCSKKSQWVDKERIAKIQKTYQERSASNKPEKH